LYRMDLLPYKGCRIRADIAPTREGGPYSLSEIIVMYTRGGVSKSQQLFTPDDGQQIFQTEMEAHAYALSLAKKWIDENL
ncbi:MAG: hypothetical protein AABZ64_01600, partial [Nitrospinota bacterium]